MLTKEQRDTILILFYFLVSNSQAIIIVLTDLSMLRWMTFYCIIISRLKLKRSLFIVMILIFGLCLMANASNASYHHRQISCIYLSFVFWLPIFGHTMKLSLPLKSNQQFRIFFYYLRHGAFLHSFAKNGSDTDGYKLFCYPYDNL